jgi:bacteriocin biosynthesis cyclodehydratase domain-containing protein
LSALPVTLGYVRPALKPGLLPVWRDRDTLQIGIDSRRAVALTGMAGAASVIGLLDGSRDRAQVTRAAGDQGIPADVVDRVLALLAAAGALDDFPAGTLRVLSAPLRARLAAELATASLAHRDGDGGARTLARRLAAQVRVHGGGRVAGGISGLLTAAGVGRVLPDEEAAQAEPSTGPEPDTGADPVARTARVGEVASVEAGRAAGKGRSSGAGRAAAAAAGAAGPGNRPDLAILVGRHSLDLRAALMREQIPHLAASADEAIGVVGPLVIPGRTACLRCLDLARADRDPAWPLILAQLDGRQPDPPACDAPLAAAVAAQAAAQALAFIDRDAPAGAVTDGTLELVLPGWQWRRRTWPRHNGCSCGSYTFR